MNASEIVTTKRLVYKRPEPEVNAVTPGDNFKERTTTPDDGTWHQKRLNNVNNLRCRQNVIGAQPRTQT